jgi:hypothetical protein
MSSSTTTIQFLCAALLGVLGSGCGEDLSSELNKNDPPIGQLGRITNSQAPGDSISTKVDATDAMSWVYFQLSSGKEVTPQSPQNSTDWDVALLRYHVKVNGGVSGSGGAMVGLIGGTSFDAIAQAPADGYVTDKPDGADDDQDPDYGFAQLGPWYNYNVMTHMLTPKDQVYVVRAPSGAHYKVQLTGYYDTAGSAGFPTFRWKEIASP